MDPRSPTLQKIHDYLSLDLSDEKNEASTEVRDELIGMEAVPNEIKVLLILEQSACIMEEAEQDTEARRALERQNVRYGADQMDAESKEEKALLEKMIQENNEKINLYRKSVTEKFTRLLNIVSDLAQFTNTLEEAKKYISQVKRGGFHHLISNMVYDRNLLDRETRILIIKKEIKWLQGNLDTLNDRIANCDIADQARFKEKHEKIKTLMSSFGALLDSLSLESKEVSGKRHGAEALADIDALIKTVKNGSPDESAFKAIAAWLNIHDPGNVACEYDQWKMDHDAWSQSMIPTIFFNPEPICSFIQALESIKKSIEKSINPDPFQVEKKKKQ